ncbi:MAG TPA: GNAT family N-acetyltransferase [Candidatus Dependentiae bacterium]|nr:GNAT family N-acetyltransferase [Candidatus Dependentiae bacterium]HRQ62857.1 GNAT family N-acetyltransferase [Candidatus Dependentiae bacterium]
MNKLMKKIIIAASLIGIAGVGYYYVQHQSKPQQVLEQGPFYTYDEARDLESILKLFQENWYWLIASRPDYSREYAEYFFKYRAPTRNPLHAGILQIKVLRVDNQLAGFTAYYKENPQVGILLFLAVDPIFRGKGYGEQLARFAVNDLIAQGAKKIQLVTRTVNFAAQKIYKRLGFQEVYRDDEGYVYFEYMVPTT